MSAAAVDEIALCFAADHPAFAGHFPGRPIVPGVLLLDAAVAALARRDGGAVGEIVSAKFLRPVAPGEPLVLRLAATEGGKARFSIEGPHGTVAQGQLAA